MNVTLYWNEIKGNMCRVLKNQNAYLDTFPTVKYGGKSIIIWGSIKYDGTRFLIKCPDKLNSEGHQDMLDFNLLHFYNSKNILQQDNTPCYKVKNDTSGKQ